MIFYRNAISVKRIIDKRESVVYLNAVMLF